MSKTSGYSGDPEPKKKVWLVLPKVHGGVLEDKLNEHAEKGYQAFRIDRILMNGGDVYYDVILFSPTLLGELNVVALTAMMNKAAESAAQVAGQPPPK